MLLPIIQPELDKDRAMQLDTFYFKLKQNEISKDGFVQHMRSIVGDQILKMAVYKVQMQAAKNSESTNNASSPSMPHLGPTDVSQFDRPSFADPKRTQAHINSNAAMQQNAARWPGKEVKSGVSSSMNYTQQKRINQSKKVRFKDQLFPKPSNAPTQKPLIGETQPLEGSSPNSSSKKQKVSGAFLDQSIEQLNDVTAVNGVNLRFQDLEKAKAALEEELAKSRQEIEAVKIEHQAELESVKAQAARDLVAARLDGARAFRSSGVYKEAVARRSYYYAKTALDVCIAQTRRLGGYVDGFTPELLDLGRDAEFRRYLEEAQASLYDPTDEFVSLAFGCDREDWEPVAAEEGDGLPELPPMPWRDRE